MRKDNTHVLKTSLNESLTLSKDDISRWLESVIYLPKTSDGMIDWIEGPLKNFFPFSRLFCVHGELFAGRIHITHWKTIGHDSSYLEKLTKTFELASRGSLARWFVNREPFLIEIGRAHV